MIYRRFFTSVQKETAWLNKMGAQGYRLEGRKEHAYEFSKTEDTVWYYRVEWMDHAADSEQMQPYLDSRESCGAEIAAVWSLWVYFISDCPIPADEEMLIRTAKHYRNPAFFVFFLDVIAAVLFYVQWIQRDVLAANGVTITVPTAETASNPIVAFCKRLVYGGKVLLYYYGKFWSNLFGDTEAALVMGILVPVILILTIVGIKYLVEWRRVCSELAEFRAEQKKAEKEEEALTIAEQEVSEENL